MAEKKRGPLGFLSAASFPYRRKSLLSPTELEFYNVLKLAVGDRFLILLKLDLRDLCEITHRDVNQAAFNRVADEKMDFVLCDQATLAPVVAIELDDSTLYPRDRAERDLPSRVEWRRRNAGLWDSSRRRAFRIGESRCYRRPSSSSTTSSSLRSAIAFSSF